ncbi:MAG: LptA/OstA family protein [Opitutaceae bacterium]|jgi:lipopolysaccharide export system protein LptA
MTLSLLIRRLSLGAGLLAISLGSALSADTKKPAAPAGPVIPTVITSKSLEMWSTDTDTHSIFDQNVVVTGNNMRMTCDHLDVLAARLGDTDATVGKLDKFKTLVATGNVRIVQGDRDVTCGRAEVFPRENRIVLTEHPVVIDSSGPYVAKGTKIILLRGERRLFGENIEITGPPFKDLGEFADKPMQAPAPASAAVPVGETPPALRRDTKKP